MFIAYFDESGTHKGSPAIVIAGYLSSDKRWSKFQVRWKEILNEAEIEFFHMADYESRQGPYKNWTDAKRIKVITQIIGAIKKRTEVGISTAIIRADYEKAKEKIGYPVVSAYSFCVFKALFHVEMWADEFKHTEPIAYVFEQGAGYQRELDDMRRWIESNEEIKKRLRWGSFTTADKRLLNPLQAADIHAFETYKEMDNFIVLQQEVRGLRKSMIELIKGERYYGTFCSLENQNLETFLR